MSDMMVLGELLEEHRKLKAAVDQFGAKLEAVYGFTNETNVVVKDILSGLQISKRVVRRLIPIQMMIA